jgi:hypothetical protein
MKQWEACYIVEEEKDSVTEARYKVYVRGIDEQFRSQLYSVPGPSACHHHQGQTAEIRRVRATLGRPGMREPMRKRSSVGCTMVAHSLMTKAVAAYPAQLLLLYTIIYRVKQHPPPNP